jgi:hypothetical protein
MEAEVTHILHHRIPQAAQGNERGAELGLKPAPQSTPPRDVCPECGVRMQPEGRCLTCLVCGFSRCGT